MNTRDAIVRVVLFLLGLFIFLWGFFTTDYTKFEANRILQEQKKQEQTLQETANQAVNLIQYIKDPRTGICFAFYRGYGEPALATVPEEKIPPELLKVAQPPFAEELIGPAIIK